MRSGKAALWLLAVLPASCNQDELHQCDGGTSTIVCSLDATADAQASDASGNVTYVVTITAAVPNLQGGAQALVSTSDGTVADMGPGKEAMVFLAPAPNAPDHSGMLAGKVTWHVPPKAMVELTVRMEEAFKKIDVTTP